jgi:hypothetical protein|tara:strand:- start:63 stop:650 length:588 start_codon:yes stop_codon:yes gene_type:complete
MANKDAAFGLRPSRMMGGAPYSGGQSRYRIASGLSGKIFQGDLVKQVTGGGIERAAAGSTVPVVGVFNGVQYTDPTTGEQVFKNHYPGSISASDIIAFVVDDPSVVFEVQADDTFPVADLFGNFDIVDQSTTGDTSSGRSNMELDVTTGATTTTLPLKAIDISQDPDNDDVASANTNVMVVIQNHIAGVKSAGLA